MPPEQPGERSESEGRARQGQRPLALRRRVPAEGRSPAYCYYDRKGVRNSQRGGCSLAALQYRAAVIVMRQKTTTASPDRTKR